jgi:segregation and condensation protein A
MEYRVATDIFEGPLGLLLALVRRRELDVCDLSLAEVASEFVKHIEQHPPEPDDAGEFLVVAAALVELKSGRLLPREEDPTEPVVAASDQPAGGAELVRRLLEYERFRQLGDRLAERGEAWADRAARVPTRRDAAEDDRPPEVELDDLHVGDLLDIYERLLTEVGRRGPVVHGVEDDERPAEVVEAEVLGRLRADPDGLSLPKLLLGGGRRAIIGRFLVLLELLKNQRVRLVREDDELRVLDADRVAA